MFEALQFLVVVEFVGIIAYPLLLKISNGTFSMSKPFGLSLLTTFSILLSLSNFFSYRFCSFAAICLLILFSMLLGELKLSFDREDLLDEVIFVTVYLLSLIYLSFKPEIYFAYSEDFADFAFLKSILKFGIPLKDPWFGGELIPYYFFGHAASASLISLSGVKAEVGYNLAVAMYYSMSVQLAFWLGRRITGKYLYGALTAIFVSFLGFLSGFFQLVAFLLKTEVLGFKAASTTFAEFVANFDFSAATRIIPGAVVFYPFFTFLQGDLHAHFMSIPFQLALLGSVYLMRESFEKRKVALSFFFFAVLAGVNVWSALVSLPILVRGRNLFVALLSLPIIVIVLLKIGLVGFVEERTGVLAFAQVFAVFLLITFLFAFRNFRVEAILALLLIPLGFLLGFQLLFLLPLSVAFLKEEDFESDLTFASILTFLFCELVYFNDPLGKPYERMNTVMKFYLSAWILWGTSSSLLFRRLGDEEKVAVVLVIVLSLVHPVASLVAMPNSQILGTTEKITLDGMEWLKEQHPEEYEAIKWLENKSGVVLEAPGVSYEYSSRVSTFTGLPTLLGWSSHEIMWGRGWRAVEERKKAVDDVYLKGNYKVVDRYGVKYIFFGEVERKRYGKEELDYPWLKVAFKRGNVVVYEVLR